MSLILVSSTIVVIAWIAQLLLRRDDSVNMMDLQQEHPDIYENLARIQVYCFLAQTRLKMYIQLRFPDA